MTRPPEKEAPPPAGTSGGSGRIPPRGANKRNDSTADSAYVYQDDGGADLYRKIRVPESGGGKSFRFEHPDGRGRWASGRGADPVLYRLPELVAADPEDVVFYTEGEKDCDRVRSLGFVATTAGGTSDWLPRFARYFVGRRVAILPDNDAPGRKLAEEVAADVHVGAASVRVVELPGLPPKGDISDWLDAGHTVEELTDLVAEAPVWQPPIEATEASPATPEPWPAIDPAAFHGLAGDVVRVIEPATEADPAALLAQLLAAFGSVVGRGPHWRVGATPHYSILFVLVVGDTGTGRKGTGWDWVENVVRSSDPAWQVRSGLSSGEGVISFVRDPVETWSTKEQEMVVSDNGVDDKRMLVVETEFASVLQRIPREGNSLSPVIRNCWDGKTLATLTKLSSLKATNPHVSVIGHITAEELRRRLDRTEVANGFANRFLFVASKRSKLLPHGGQVDELALRRVKDRVAGAIAKAKGTGLVPFDREAHALWVPLYERLSEGGRGMAAELTARAAPQVRRLALVYALMDGSAEVTADHLQAAIALWEYCAATCRYVFGKDSGDPDAERVFALILGSGSTGLTRARLQDRLGRHWTATRINRVIDLLQRSRRISVETAATGGRPSVIYRVAS